MKKIILGALLLSTLAFGASEEKAIKITKILNQTHIVALAINLHTDKELKDHSFNREYLLKFMDGLQDMESYEGQQKLRSDTVPNERIDKFITTYTDLYNLYRDVLDEFDA